MTSVFQGLSFSRSLGRVGENPGTRLLLTMANGAPDWCSIVEADLCLSINCKSILIIPFLFADGTELF